MQTKKTITFLINNMAGGGAERVLNTLMTEFVRRGYIVTLICVEEMECYAVPPEVNRVYLVRGRLYFTKYMKYLLLPLLAWRLANYIKKHNVSVINSHLFYASYVSILAQKLFNAQHKSIVTTTTALERFQKGNVHGWLNKSLIKWFYPLADVHIFKSKKMQAGYQCQCTIKRSVQIYNPLDLDAIKATPTKPKTDDKFIVMSMGRLIAAKRHRDIITALSQLDERCALHILGTGSLQSSLLELARDLGVQNRVHFEGFLQQPDVLLKQAHCYVSASAVEGFPSHILEAMACSLPTIASDCLTGPREILAPNGDMSKSLMGDIEVTDYGILYPVGNVEQLVLAVRYVMDNPENVNRMVQNSLGRLEEFAISTITDQYEHAIVES